MNNESFLIEEDDLESAKKVVRYIDTAAERERATANVLAAKIAKKFFEDYEVDIVSGLHNIPQILSDIEISDIYIKGSYIDVRVYFNDKDLFVPKSHFELGMLPLAYMFIKLDKELSGGYVTGFIIPSAVDRDLENGSYYAVKEEQLESFYDIEPVLTSVEERELPKDFGMQVFDFLDNKLEARNEFYDVLTHSKDAREILSKAAYAQNVFNFISVVPTREAAGDVLLPTDDAPLNLEEVHEIELAQDFSDGNYDELEISMEDAELLESPVDSDGVLLEHDGESVINLEEKLNVVPEITEETQTITTNSYESIELPNESETSEMETYKGQPLVLDEYQSVNVEEPIVDEEAIVPVGEVDFSTSTTPSIQHYEEVDSNEGNFDDEELMRDLAQDENKQVYNKVVEPITTEGGFAQNKQIDTLFNQEFVDTDEEETYVPLNPKRKGSFIPLLGFLAIAAAVGYYGYTKFTASQVEPSIPVSTKQISNEQPVNVQKEAMPIESIENLQKELTSNEGIAESIPAIEQNLDASILISNLSINWEVPAGYVSNNTAKRYLTKIGKIIQLNLKTELLLLSKPPITNKIAIEVEFDKNISKFIVKGITTSSGEEIVDKVILNTVKSALNTNLKMNLANLANIKGNPVLIIRL